METNKNLLEHMTYVLIHWCNACRIIEYVVINIYMKSNEQDMHSLHNW